MAAIAFPYNANGVVGHSSNMDKENVITRIASGVAAGAATKIGFAQPVMRGTAAKTCVMWDGTKPCLGLTRAEGWIDPAVGYANGDNVPVQNEGQMWVLASTAVTAGATPLFDPATGGYGNATTGSEPLALVGCVFEETVAAGGVARMQIHKRIA